ncbi:heterogeneous nuclear ribonucleoprotein C-like isoform X2 [Electrophorus electricus]|uniref:heterogeneous nuclear ribonucleoprotein C-like isoform X2 n=1 Tax=Electrophorus electricus TaxID=8005 RepID=UPI000F09EC3D|nr:heterogeneous nuclear ribonucleoprotein C-like isoform X2 [Electrophorus electricus]
MTLFKSEHRSPQYMSMTGELTSSRVKTAGTKRPSGAVYGSEYEVDYDCYQEDLYDRVYDYQRVPSAMPPLARSSGLAKRPRTSSSRQRHSRERSSSRSSRPHSSRRAKLKMEELQTIKRELTLIKVQIDGLLDSLDRMDRQRQEHTGSPFSEGGSLGGSPYHPSASSREGSPRSPNPHCRARRDSPELGEASDDDPHMIHHHNSDLEDEI